MDYRRFGDSYIVRIDRGEEILEQVKAFAEKESVRLAAVQALGAVCSFTVGAFDTGEKRYHANSFEGVWEIVSLVGTIDTKDDAFYTHLHMCAADATGRAVGGHLSRAVVSATCEMVVRLIPGRVDRRFDEETGLNLFAFRDE